MHIQDCLEEILHLEDTDLAASLADASRPVSYTHLSIRHGLWKDHGAGVLLPGLEAVIGFPGGVDQRLPRPGGAADGQLLQGAAVAAHGVALEVGQHQHGVIMQDVFAHVVLLQDLAIGDGPHHVGALGVHQVHVEVLGPAMLLQQLPVGLRMIPDTAGRITIGGIALHDGAVDLLYHGTPEFRTQEILVALLPGVDLHGHLAGPVSYTHLRPRHGTSWPASSATGQDPRT